MRFEVLAEKIREAEIKDLAERLLIEGSRGAFDRFVSMDNRQRDMLVASVHNVATKFVDMKVEDKL